MPRTRKKGGTKYGQETRTRRRGEKRGFDSPGDSFSIKKKKPPYSIHFPEHAKPETVRIGSSYPPRTLLSRVGGKRSPNQTSFRCLHRCFAMSSSDVNGASRSGQKGDAASPRASVSGSERSRDEPLDSPLPSDAGNANNGNVDADLFGSDGSDEEVE